MTRGVARTRRPLGRALLALTASLDARRLLARARRLAPPAFAVALTAALIVALAWTAGHRALIDEARFVRPLETGVVLDRHGHTLRRPLAGTTDTVWVQRDDVPEHVVRAFLAAEDERFETHGGVDPIAIARAALGNLTGARLSGASTLTQQVVKLVYGRPHGAWDKPLEVLRAIELEARMSKDEILEQYLNRVPMGNGIVGVGRAAEAYFGHPLAEVTLAEAALLAGIPQAPSITEPRRHAGRARARRDYVLGRLEELGWAEPEALAAARAELVVAVTRAPRPWEAPRFVDRVLALRRARPLAHGPDERTSLDLSLQHEAEAHLGGAVARLSARGAENGAALVVDAQTGEILAYVGAVRTGDDAPGGELDLLRAARQPGSTLKPFAYGLFFESGAGPATLVDDVRTPMRLGDGTRYVARDFDGRERGPVRARTALASSLNLAAIDVVRRVGPSAFVDRLQLLGFARAAAADRESAALVLGGLDVDALELARAYAVLARGGRALALTPFVHARAEEGERIADEASVALVSDVLSDGVARAEAFGRSLEDEAGGPFALKTGTSAGFHDAWAVAYDEGLVVVVWVGSPSRHAMDHVSGFEAAAPVAAHLLGAGRRARGTVIAPARSILASVEVCPLSGALASPHCPHRVTERFDPAHLPTATCALHDAAGAHLPERFAEWASHDPTRRADDARPSITSPADGAVLAVPRDAPWVPVRSSAPRLELDGAPSPSDLVEVTAGEHELVAIGGAGRRSVHFTVVYVD